ncbi:hypothetical protein Syun_009442 [Stephania yunnanensis]|uniref:Uncharacterized protein n=1 Tax=Stephania yunnanensis TaxID=152371 RepID=A0AAP0PNJ3_9MAGN
MGPNENKFGTPLPNYDLKWCPNLNPFLLALGITWMIEGKADLYFIKLVEFIAHPTFCSSGTYAAAHDKGKDYSVKVGVEDKVRTEVKAIIEYKLDTTKEKLLVLVYSSEKSLILQGNNFKMDYNYKSERKVHKELKNFMEMVSKRIIRPMAIGFTIGDEEMRQDATGVQIIEALIANSSTFEKKTSFSQWNAKVSDFGLAKLLFSERSYVTTRVMGTYGLVYFTSHPKLYFMPLVMDEYVTVAFLT